MNEAQDMIPGVNRPTGTILRRLKTQLKNDGIDVSHVQTISQALRKFDASVTGNTIAECLDDVYPMPINQAEDDGSNVEL